ncbi:MAG: Hsp20/alpha crystallin family protein [Ignavibacteriales bacterium]|nr:Hsp20/alpha crystallin family protein [Ignavibacteriales bacterium]
MTLTRWTPVRNITRFNPFGDFNEMEHRMNRLLDSFFSNSTVNDDGIVSARFVPATDIAEFDEHYLVTVDLPGLKKDEIKITLEDHTLTISGEKKFENEEKKDSYHRVERGYGRFERAFTLPQSVKTDKIDAKYKDGVLSLTVPKAEEAKQRTIEVKVS